MSSQTDGKFVCPHCGDWHPTSTDACPTNKEPIANSHKLVGSVMEGKYKITQLIGEGGMGVVYEATHTLIGRRLAVKVLHSEVSQMPELVERFYNEARTAAAIGHEHIIEITDMGVHNNQPFIVMEFLEGLALTDYMRDRLLSIPESVAITIQVLDALNAVHAKGVIHRDLKPDNIHILTKSGRQFVKILDFGISKLKTPEVQDMHLTRTGTVLGTPYYMAPEQAAGKKDQDHRIDIYAAGVILYEMLTLTLPYQGDNYNALLAAILTEEAPPPRTYNPEIPIELETIIMTAIAKKPSERYPNATRFLEVLQPFAPAWMGRPSKVPGLMQTQGGYPGHAPAAPGLVAQPTGDLGSSQTLLAPTPLPAAHTPAPAIPTGTDWSVTGDAGEEQKKSHVGLIVGVVLGILVLLAGGGVAAALVIPSLIKGRLEEKAAKQVIATKQDADEAKAPVEVAPPPEKKPDTVPTPAALVSLALEGLPEGAVVTLDGERLAELPANLPPSTKERHLIVAAEGFKDWETTLVLDAPKSLAVDLQPASGSSGKKKKEPVVVKLPTGTKPVEGDLKKPDTGKVTVTKKKTETIYTGKRKNIETDYPE